jgi:hypothetical protein
MGSGALWGLGQPHEESAPGDELRRANADSGAVADCICLV